jgi:hypothetical protein
MTFEYKRAIKKIRSEEYKGNNPVPDILGFYHLYALYGNEDKLYGILDALIGQYSSDAMSHALRKFNCEVQHLGKQEGICYPKWPCQKPMFILPKQSVSS